VLKHTFYPVQSITSNRTATLTLTDTPVAEAQRHDDLPEALREPARVIDAISRCLAGNSSTVFAHPKWVEGLDTRIKVEYVFGDVAHTDPSQEAIRRALIQTSAAKAGVPGSDKPAPAPGTALPAVDDDDEEGPEV
jgi:hypothetical protein